jgi:hypothetical protein
MDGEEGAGDRRQDGDRREGGAEPAPRSGAPARSAVSTILRALGTAVGLVVVIVFTLRTMRPVYATRGTLGDELRKRAPGVAAAITPRDSTDVEQFMATPKFQEEKRNFYEDVMRLNQVDSARADSIAQYAVREAYVRGISPAIVFGVMLTENSRFVSNAKSNVGAVGLMQVYPKVWLNKEMTALFGRDLASDSTNVKYGVFILSHYFNPKTKSGEVKPQDWATALLHYNGCVKGTNTPRCHTYPDKVKAFVENQAKSICDGRGFYDCIAKPFIQGLFGAGAGTSATSPTSTASAAATPAVQPGAAPPPNAPAPAIPRPTPPAPVEPKSSTNGRGATASRTSSTARSRKSAPVKKAPARKAPARKAQTRRAEPLPKAPKPIAIPQIKIP